MKLSILFLSLSIFSLLFGCRPRHTDSVPLAGQETSKISDRVDEDFEWLASQSQDGKKVAQRHLTYCVDGSLTAFSKTIQDVAKSITDHFEATSQNQSTSDWKLTFVAGCPEKFNLLERNPGLQPNIRFRAAQEGDALESQPVNRAQHVRIFEDVYSRAVVVIPPRTSFSAGSLGLADQEVDDDHLFTANIPNLTLAAFRYEIPLRDRFVVSADVVINTHKNIPWVIPADAKLPAEPRKLDARLLVMNLWGRILKIKPRLVPLNNEENVCTKPTAPASETAMYLYLRVAKYCLNQKNFDSLENRYQYSREDWQDFKESSKLL